METGTQSILALSTGAKYVGYRLKNLAYLPERLLLLIILADCTG